MRKVIICENLNSTIQKLADELGIGEIVEGIPWFAVGAIKDTPLPVVMVESATNTYTVLLVANASKVSKEQLDALQDLSANPVPMPLDIQVTNIQQVMDELKAKVAELEKKVR